MAHDVGTLKLIDYYIPVGNTGIVFVAALSGFMHPDGTVFFEPILIEWARHRAASTLSFMALVRGDTFKFLRESVPLTVAATATLVGYTQAEVLAWEAQTTDVPWTAWESMSDYCCTLDHRSPMHVMQLNPDFRPRTIRIVPNAPMVGVRWQGSGPCGGSGGQGQGQFPC